MSQHTLTPDRPDIAMVLIGWDPRLRTFYARVVAADGAADDTPCFWIGQSWGEFPTPQPVIRRVALYAAIPEGLAQTLFADSHPSRR